MPHFTFFLHDGPSKTPSFEIDFFESAELATRHAGRLLARNPQYTTVEVTDGAHDISRIDRPAEGQAALGAPGA
jgi:hypothetical protein